MGYGIWDMRHGIWNIWENKTAVSSRFETWGPVCFFFSHTPHHIIEKSSNFDSTYLEKAR